MFNRETAHGQGAARYNGGRFSQFSGFQYRGASTPKAKARRQKLHSVIRQLRDAKDAAAKDKATAALSALLKDEFDTDLKQREKEIAEIADTEKPLSLEFVTTCRPGIG